ncbi:Beta-1,3-galactosyl-O-glycosyl-glycoprotein beta-1,6-N-acetylglucosaminyltransferase [Bulinus truncatus]|nr:Beta-1,3-galactosyl-O-glycosyl-glycoprotein beta-1,6-N-acetylglucosaminyltransferase [Bulinus truncatus]
MPSSLLKQKWRVVLAFTLLLSLFYFIFSNRFIAKWNMSLGEEKTGLTYSQVTIKDERYTANNSIEIEVSGNDSKTENSILANMVSYIRWLPEKWNFGQKWTNIMKANSRRRHLEFTCQGRQLDEMETIFHVPEVNCRKLLSGDHDEMVYAQNLTKTLNRALLSEHFYLNLTIDCELFQSQRGYIMCPLTSEEDNFPLAFSMMVYKDVEMVERLLRSIYRPQNYYCIHVDKKSDEQFMKAVSAIASCFENVFLVPERVDVQWGQFSVLEPELICMKHLWKYKKWKYFMNLTGQEFPLKTNWELVQILKAYNGANNVDGTMNKSLSPEFLTLQSLKLTEVLTLKLLILKSAPYRCTPYTGSYLTDPHLTGLHLIDYRCTPYTGSYLTDPHLTGLHLIDVLLAQVLTLQVITLQVPPLTSPDLTDPHLTDPHLTGPHLTGPHLTGPHLTGPHITGPQITGPQIINPLN